MNSEEHLSGVLAAEIAREIDKEIVETLMIDVLIGEGWVDSKIKAPYRDWYIETAAWIHLNAVGDYKLLSGRWLFKDPKDATMFILKWS